MNDPKTGSAPHDCPNCGAPSYVGGPGMPTQCTSRECPFYSEDCWVRWVMEIPDEEVGQEFDIEDEDTQRYLKMPSLSDMYDDVDTGAQVRDLFYPPKSLGGPWRYTHSMNPMTPEQKKVMKDALDAAIDKYPVPSWTKPLDKD